ncbi:hypothetical protein AAY473_024250 [Plecturocebus cupreus]
MRSKLARHSGLCLQSQHFGRPRREITRSGDQDQPGQAGKNPVSTKNTEISQAWEPVVPATPEAEAGELLEPGRCHSGCPPKCAAQKLLGMLRQENHLSPGGGDCSEQRSQHCPPAWAIERDCLKNKNKTANTTTKPFQFREQSEL